MKIDMLFWKRIKRKLGVILSSKYKIVKLSSFVVYCNKEKFSSLISIDRDRRTNIFPVHFWGEAKADSMMRKLPDTYCANIMEASIIGQSSAVLTKDRYLLYDILCDKKNENINVTDSGLLLLLNRVIHFRRIFILNYFKKRGCYIEKGIMLSGNFSNNYYHFCVEYLVKFELLEALNIDCSVPLIVDSSSYSIPQIRELFELFNVNNRKVIVIDDHFIYKVSELFVLSSVNEIAPNRKKNKLSKNTDFAIDNNSLIFLRNSVFNRLNVKCETFPKQRIYLSRLNSTHRKCNESEIIEIVKDYGFVVIYPEKLSFAEQVCYFRNAAYLISPTGAALTNIIFTDPLCKILVLQGGHKDIPIFTNLVGYQGNNIQYIVSSESSIYKTHSDYYIPISAIKEYLDLYLGV